MADSRYAGEAGLQAVFGQIKAAMAEKQDKVNDMGLSHNDYSDTEKQKNAQNASDIVSLNNDIDDIIEKRDGDATLYQFAPVVTVEDAVPGNVALRAKVEPQQDLHGYDKPWVGGAGKNKLPLVLADIKAANIVGTWIGNVYTGNGVTFTVNTDNDGNVVGILVNGTATGGNANFYLVAQGISALSSAGFIDNTDYLINGCPANGSDNTYRLQVESNGAWKIDKGTGSSITYISGGQDTVRIQIIENYAIPTGGLTFYPMIRLATETDATFAPYTNICSIAQYDSCKITRIGKNLCSELESGTLNDNGLNSDRGNRVRTKYYIRVVEGQQYVLRALPSVSGKVVNIAFNGFTKDDYNTYRIYDSGWLASGSYITIPSGVKFVRCVFRYTTNDSITPSSFEDVQLEIGSTATTYESYKGNDYQIELNGNTYYGKVRIDTQGNVYFDVDRAIKVYDGSDDESWSKYGAGSAAAFAMKIAESDVKANITESSKLIANYLKKIPTVGTWGNFDNWVTTGALGGELITGIQSITELADWKTYLASHNLQVVYELATPTTIQLTPQQIQLLKGQNTIYADTGDVEVTVNNTMDAIGSMQEQVNELDSNLTNLIKSQEFTVTTDATGNARLYVGIRHIISAYAYKSGTQALYRVVPFWLNNPLVPSFYGTYIEVYATADNIEHVKNEEITGVYYYI